MKRPMVRIHNTETNEVIDREMNDVEYEQHLADVAAYEAKIAEIEAAAIAKASLLERLNISSEEASLLLG